jgi:hypothetical protein
MKLVFYATVSPFGILISKVTRSRWSHVEMIFDDGTVYFARAGQGVGKSTWAGRLAKMKWTYHWEVDSIELADEQAARDFLEAQLGKTYDWLAVFGFILPFRANLDVKSKWFCSELAQAACAAGGTPLVRDKARYVNPEMAYLSTALKLEEEGTRPWKEVFKSIFAF